jgi:hypothetical protein
MKLPTMDQAKAEYFQLKVDNAKTAAAYSKANPAQEDLTSKYEADVVKFTKLVKMYS